MSLPILSERVSEVSNRLVNCSGCTACCEHGGLVYVLDEEVEVLRHLGVPMVAVGGVTFIKRLPSGACPMLDLKNRRCSIYEQRPLCCRMFPLDVLQMDGRLQWAITHSCPPQRKRFESGQESANGFGSGALIHITAALEAHVTSEDLRFFGRKEKVAARVEFVECDYKEWVPAGDVLPEDFVSWPLETGIKEKYKEDLTKKIRKKKRKEDKEKKKKRKKK